MNMDRIRRFVLLILLSVGGAALAMAAQASRVLPVRAAARPDSFLYDVGPVLSRAGCNQGVCHGNANGKGGFRLSLRGEDPRFHSIAASSPGSFFFPRSDRI